MTDSTTSSTVESHETATTLDGGSGSRWSSGACVLVEPAAAQSAGSAFCDTDMAQTIQNIFTLIQFGGPLVGGVVLAVALVGVSAVAPALAHPENETDHDGST